MGRKKSGRLAAQGFQKRVDDLVTYCRSARDALKQQQAAAGGADRSDLFTTWTYEGALIKLAAAFDRMMLDCLVAAINNDTTATATVIGVSLPAHLTDEVCEYLVVGGGYFDYKGRDGLIKTLKSYLPDTHYLVAIIKDPAFRQPLDQGLALRNFGAHESKKSKEAARKAVGVNLAAAGAWLKRENGLRFETIANRLKQLAQGIEAAAPH
ncbi:MAG: hypothetical protein M3082_12080 [Candidatus Dormibacteraeota bacterium]|nr:hypothetical protein [Candidatus Dormibacteraeota bacterium]